MYYSHTRSKSNALPRMAISISFFETVRCFPAQAVLQTAHALLLEMDSKNHMCPECHVLWRSVVVIKYHYHCTLYIVQYNTIKAQIRRDKEMDASPVQYFFHPCFLSFLVLVLASNHFKLAFDKDNIERKRKLWYYTLCNRSPGTIGSMYLVNL